MDLWSEPGHGSSSVHNQAAGVSRVLAGHPSWHSFIAPCLKKQRFWFLERQNITALGSSVAVVCRSELSE